jgi:hypothetical protein
MGFFPEGIELSSILSPSEILEEARREWEVDSNGLLLLRISQVLIESEEETILDVYIVHSPSKRMAKVLSLAHRPNQPYPIEIRPESFNIPKYLKKSYEIQTRRSPSSSVFSSLVDQMRALERTLPEVITKTITNEWVCDTPAEFREKLEKVFNLGVIKSTINNIIAGSSVQDDGEIDGFDDSETLSEIGQDPGDALNRNDPDQA